MHGSTPRVNPLELSPVSGLWIREDTRDTIVDTSLILMSSEIRDPSTTVDVEIRTYSKVRGWS